VYERIGGGSISESPFIIMELGRLLYKPIPLPNDTSFPPLSISYTKDILPLNTLVSRRHICRL
jgi:hypothetical protein